jgi:uncharacterized RDD family membrane protein YckC
LEKVNITSSHNVQISYALASIGDRLLAYLIDSLILIAYIVIVLLSMGLLGGFQNLNSDLLVVAIVIVGIPFLFYHLLFEVFMNGQSIGKKAMSVKVVNLDGSQPSLGNYLLRWILRPIDFSFYGAIAILCIALGKKGQRLGDMAAGTTVISLKMNKPYLQEHTLSKINQEYEPTFSEEIKVLSDQQINVIKRALTLYEKQGNQTPADSLAVKIRGQFNTQGPGHNVEYLDLLVKDYEYYESHA